MADERKEPGAPKRRRRPGRLKRLTSTVRTLWHEPRSAGSLARSALLELWRARGGGFYGLGYVVTFLVLEVRMLAGELGESASLAAFVGSQLLEYVFRVGILSLLNALQAFIWPLLILAAMGGWAIVLLAAGYVVFERWLRPRLETAFPELR